MNRWKNEKKQKRTREKERKNKKKWSRTDIYISACVF
jgi:hypothetical protein